MFTCQECEKRFTTVAAARRAAAQGCPRCGSCDVDLGTPREARPVVAARPLSRFRVTIVRTGDPMAQDVTHLLGGR